MLVDSAATLPLVLPEGSSRVETPSATGESAFAETLESFVNEVDDAQKTAQTATTDFAEGRSNDIHGTMIAMQRADVSFRLLASVRNRALEVYREVMRMGA